VCLQIGFPGANGPIFSVYTSDVSPVMYIGGAFNNIPSVVSYCFENNSVGIIGDDFNLYGEITAVTEVLSHAWTNVVLLVFA
jgi:hypothetical protein